MSAELFAVIRRQRFDFFPKRLEPIDDCSTDQICRLVPHLGNHRINTFAFHHRHDGLPVIRTNHRVTLPVPHLLAILYVRRALAQRASIGYLPSAVLASGIAFFLLLLTAQVLPQLAAIGFARVNVQIKRFMTNRQLASNLLRTPLQSKQHVRLAYDLRLDLTCIATALRANQRQLTGLIGPIAAAAFVAAKLTADRGLVAPKLLSNLYDALIGFHEAVN